MNHNCTTCGAKLEGGEVACKFCGTATPWGAARKAEEVRMQAAQAHIVAQADQQKRQIQTATGQRSAQHALAWSLVGLFFVCIPVPAFVAIVFARRSAQASKAARLPVPGSATAAIVIAGLELLSFAAFVVFAVVSASHHAHEKEALTKAIEPGAAASTLDRGTACAMAHLHVLEHGWGKAGGNIVEAFDCPGKLGQLGDHAWVDDVRFKPGSTAAQVRVSACFKKGGRWTVDDLRIGGACPGSLEATTPAPAVTPTLVVTPTPTTPARAVTPTPVTPTRAVTPTPATTRAVPAGIVPTAPAAAAGDPLGRGARDAGAGSRQVPGPAVTPAGVAAKDAGSRAPK